MMEEARVLSGHDADTLHWLIEDGALGARRNGDGRLIAKAALREFQETLLEVRQMVMD